ncbi:PBECR2 nuclease fold domain-containing protein [Ottowia sp.]|uniref:PBECR2 nuclease fold domain-containing protein n=1 Tax=Ottowia sp. TaxID=1898956 RepID=UPI003A8512F3
MAEAAYGSLPFAEQIAFFRRKLDLPTEAWTDIWAQEHDWAFVVAGANRNDIVADFRAAVERAISEGASLEQFRKDFDAIVAKHGWDYNGGRDWRSRVIYETNLNTSYAAGRYEQLQAAPYWQYVHADWVANPRHDHLAWDGLVLARGDPWWAAHFPPNGWGCQCTVRGLWQRDLERLGKEAPDEAPEVHMVDKLVGVRGPMPRTVRLPVGIDPGFEYTPGKARLESAMPPERPLPLRAGSSGGYGLPNTTTTLPMPPARPFDAARLLPSDQESPYYAEAFLAEFGATLDNPVIFEDVLGERLVLGRDLFTDKRTGGWKDAKMGRGPYMPLVAETVIEPDEIWLRMEWIKRLNKAVVKRRYIARFDVEGKTEPGVVVFDWGADGWSGVTAFAGSGTGDVDVYINDQRVGVRIYRRLTRQ